MISYRLKGNHEKHSLVFSIKWQLTTETLPSCVGWEKNENHKLMPRKVDLKHVLDPLCLAENSVDLNLKLMRWRLVPSLDLDKISSTRCLILGSGTLGCYVARGLLVCKKKNIIYYYLLMYLYSYVNRLGEFAQ